MYRCKRCPECEQRITNGVCGCTIRPDDPTQEKLRDIIGEPPSDDTRDDDIEVDRRLHEPDCQCDPLEGIVCGGCVMPCDDGFFLRKYSEPEGKAETRRFGKIAEAITHNELHRRGSKIGDR